MTAMATVMTGRWRRPWSADRILRGTASLWWAAALAGQWVFFYYIYRVYAEDTVTGNFAGWITNPMLIKGYVPGDTAGNVAFGVHVLMAGVIAFGGALQLVPLIRRRAPSVHRWIGRVFMVTALGVSVTGLYMVWIRGARLNLTGALAISGDATLIIVFALLAWRAALARDFAQHRRQALRLFLVANGQWFFRVAIFGWVLITQSSLGLGKQLDGPVSLFWDFGCYLVPLALLELYLRAPQRSPRAPQRSPRAQLATAGALGLATLYMIAGIAGLYVIVWQPLLAKV